MKLTPLEMRQKQFTHAFRGYDKEEVEEFLRLAAEEMEEIVRENTNFRERVTMLESTVGEFKDREKTLKETLVTAQKMSEEMRTASEKEARIIVSNAELEGERVMQSAIRRRDELLHEIHDLKRQKVQFESTLRNVIEVHYKMLDALAEHEKKKKNIEEEPDDNLSYLIRGQKQKGEQEKKMDDVVNKDK